MINTFDKIYKAYRADVHGFLLKITGYKSELAEELTQETFFQAYKSMPKFKGECSVKTWLCQIAKNTFFTYLRKNKKANSFNYELISDGSPDPNELLSQRELINDAMIVISSFSNKMADVMLFRIIEDIPYSQISQILKISESSAKVLFYRGKALLKNKLKEVYRYEI
jgi:RNA polymerase sigma factor (sigma-70 family)